MKDIRIKRLALENFKCHKSLTIDFNGRNASICGDNATGKTSIYDALTWLLFGKDSRGNGEKNIEIKPLNAEGEVNDHWAITEVEAVLPVDGEEITLKRTLKEVWSTKRGHSEPTYDGNTSEYYIDGVPVKKYAFAEKVDELVDEDTFRMLTSVSNFAEGISWQDRRAELFKVAGVADDAAIMATDGRFASLAEGMGKLTVEDYRKKLTAEKKKYTGAKNELPARISECEKTVADVAVIDFEAVRAEVQRLTAEKNRLDAEIVAIEHDGATDGKRVEIKEAQFELAQLEGDNRLYRDTQTVGAVDVKALRRDLARYTSELDSKERSLTALEKKLRDLDYQIAACRDRWLAVAAETFTGGNCPTCGQTLPTGQLEAARKAFEDAKRDRQREIESTASAYKATRSDTAERIKITHDEITLAKTCMDAKQEEIDRAEASHVEPVDMDGYADRRKAIEDRIAYLNGELADMMTNSASVRDNLRARVREIKDQIAAKSEELGKEALLTYSRERIETLREDARKTAAALDEIEQMLYLMDEYSRYKTQFVEDSVNGLFKIARFRLFREQANGGIEDRCDVVYDGVPYASLNNAARINVGIDIINTLSRAYGVRVPLFVDNAESVTRLEGSNSQIIRLVVSEHDKEVRINHED